MPQQDEPAPFLLHESSPAFLEGDAEGLGRRFAFHRDALDYLAMAGIVVGVLVLLVNLVRFLKGAGVSRMASEQHGNPGFASLGVDQTASATQSGGNMEGKETRFGIGASALFATATTGTSAGAVNRSTILLSP
mgnify:CR=1 FL=1